MIGPCCGLFFSLLVLLERPGVILSSPPVPQIQCPVGVSVDAALYFKTLSGARSPAIVTSTITSMNATEKRTELESELTGLIRLPELQDLSEAELVNLASLYYGLTQTLQTEISLSSLGPAQLRELAEMEVSSGFSGLSEVAQQYLPWIFGSLTHQQLILIACGAQFTVPSDLPFKLGQTGSCYSESDLRMFTTTDGQPCRQKCREEGFKIQLSKETDDNCYCTNSGLQSLESCDTNTFQFNTAGLGFPLLSYEVQPQGYSSELNTVKESNFIEIGGVTFNVVLFDFQVVVFRLDGPQWEESDDAPGVRYVDHRKWDSREYRDMTFSDLNQEKNLMELNEDHEIPNKAALFDQLKLTRAESMTILPMFVTMDEQFYPDDPLQYETYDYTYYLDYETDSWKENLAARPHPGGKWFYHILIAHKSRSSKRRSNPPDMTMYRILENGTLVHMMKYKGTHGRFKTPSLKKNVKEMLPFVRGRESFFLTASVTPNAEYLSPEKYSKIQAWKMTETLEEVTKIGKTSVFEPRELGDTIQIYSSARLAKVDFLYKMFIAVLDRTSQDGPDSRIRMFSFQFSDSEDDYDLNASPLVSEIFRGELFTNLHSFISEGKRYLVVSRSGTSNSNLNTAKIFQVSFEGSLSQVGSDIRSPVSEGVLLDMKPAPSEFTSTTDLLETKSVQNGDGSYSTQVQVYIFDSAGYWRKDSNQEISSSGKSYDYSSSFDVTGVPGKLRLLGCSVRATENASSVEFDLFVIPRLPLPQVDERLRYESQVAVKIYQLDRKISQEGGRYLYDLHSNASANVDLHLQQAGSRVSGDWSLQTVTAGTVEASSIPEETKLTINMRNEEEEVKTLSDWRDVLEVNLTRLEEKLDDLSARLVELASLDADLLKLDAGHTQVVTTSISVENMAVLGRLEYPGPHPFNVQVLAKDNKTLHMKNLKDIFSFSQNNVPISGTTTFNKSTVFNGGLHSLKLASELADNETVSVSTDSLLRLVEGQTITVEQVFSAGVVVEGDLIFSEGVGVTSPAMSGVLNFAHIPLSNLSGPFQLEEVVLGGFGLSAPNLQSSFPSKLNTDQLVLKESQDINITGTLQFESSEFATFGKSVGVVDGETNVNGKNISALFENVAWKDVPDSVDTIDFESALTFPVNVVFTGNVSFEKDLDVTEINGITFTDYLQEESLSKEAFSLGGNKTFNKDSNFNEILAVTYNSLTLDQFVDKHSEQSLLASSFQDEVAVDDILPADKGGFRPTVNGLPLLTIPDMIDGTVNGSRLNMETFFSSIVIAPEAELIIRNKMNDIDLVERISQLVRTDESSVDITGGKIFPLPVWAQDIKMRNVNTDYGPTQLYRETLVFQDFVNTKNQQTIGSGKTFTGNVTFGDMFFIKADSKINNIKIAPLLECWVDINSEDEVMIIDEPVKFRSLVTDGLKISRMDSSSRLCSAVEDSLLNLSDWLAGWKENISQEAEAVVEDLTLMYLMSRCPSGSLDNVPTTGETGLTGITYLTLILEEEGVSQEELALMTVEQKRTSVNHLLASRHGIYLSELESLTTFQVVSLTCQLPKINTVDVLTDVAKLSEDNEFCSAESQCSNTFSALFQSDVVQVGGNVQTSSQVLGVSVSSLASQRVSLSSSQSLSGQYSFSQLSLDRSFQGEILYQHHGSNRSMADFTKRFLKKSDSGDQTFTAPGLSLSKLTATTSILTGDSGLTTSLNDGNSFLRNYFDIKNIYEEHFKKDDSITIPQNLEISDLKVTENMIVGGVVQGVDVAVLAGDLVISGASVDIGVGGGVQSGYTISGTADPVNITGKKDFTVSLSVGGDILAGEDLVPLVVTNTSVIQFSGEQETRIMRQSGTGQNISGVLTVDGKVEFQSGLIAERFGGGNVSDIISKYQYDSSEDVHILKTNFVFLGVLNVSDLTSDNVRGRDWNEFVADTIPVVSLEDQTITGDKTFSGSVEIKNSGSEVKTFNDLDLNSAYDEQAFIDQPVTFTASNTLTNLVTFSPGFDLRAETQLTLEDPEVETGDSITPVFDVAFVFSNSVLIEDSAQVDIRGKLIFKNNLTILEDSTVGSLGKPADFTVSISVPEELFLLDSTNLSFSLTGETHQFEGAIFNSELRLTGKIGTYDLREFDNVLYKSTDFGNLKEIFGKKTFEMVTLTQNLSSTGDINGLNLIDNLVYLDGDRKTLEGTYNFAEIEVQNLQVSGLIDTVDWDDVENHLFEISLKQNISATFSFASPTSLSFQGAVIGDGDTSNGRGFINGLSVESIQGLGDTWTTVAAVKTAAMAEANVLCRHVKDLAGAYLANMKVSYYTYHRSTEIKNANSFGDVVQMATINVGDTEFMVAISKNKIRLLSRTKTGKDYDVTDLSDDGLEVELVQDDGVSPVENCRQVEVLANVVPATEEGAVASLAIVITDQGAVFIRISGSLRKTVNMSQLGGPIPGMVGIQYLPQISTFFMAFQTPREGGFMMEVRSLPYPDIYFRSLLRCLDGGQTSLQCVRQAAWFSDLNTLWQGDQYSVYIDSPQFDAMLDTNNKVHLAVSNHYHTSTAPFVSCMKVSVLLRPGNDTVVQLEGNQLFVQTGGSEEHPDFVLLPANNFGLLVTGGEKVITTRINYQDNSFTELSRFSLPGGPASKLQRHNNRQISVLEDGTNLVFLKYAGLNGVKIDRTLYLNLKNNPVLAYTFFNPVSEDKISDNLLLTANQNNKLYLYTSRVNFQGRTMDLQCRNPEVGVNLRTSQYCEISSQHTMCQFNKKSESCNITMNDISKLDNGFDVVLLDEHNNYRSDIANGRSLRPDLPRAADMRKLSWSSELARLAEMWAAQCSSEHETVRKVLINDVEYDYDQNLITFKGKNDWEVGEASIKEMVRYWYSELNSLHLSHISNYTHQSTTENFAVLAWSRTEKIGCGWTQYVDQQASYPYMSLLVCNYLREQLMESQPIYDVGPTCSNCGVGYTCEQDSGLCTPTS